MAAAPRPPIGGHRCEVARTVAVGREIGCRGLLVHAESREARDFYRHLVPEFEPSTTDDLHLVLMVKDILRTIRS